jgi:hypothetical protein
MAGALEIAKLVCASYLYRRWENIHKLLKQYMLAATILIMAITSLGIFGFLSDAFQRNFSQYSLNIAKIQSLKSQQNFLISQVDFNKNKLKDLIELQKTYQNSLDSAVKQDVTTTKTSGGLFGGGKVEKVTDTKLLDSRNKIVENSQQNINNLFNQIQVVTTELSNLENKAAQTAQEIMILEADNTKGEIGTFKFVAEAFGMKVENAVRLFIILIVIVFDPLALSLVIAYNSITNKKDSSLAVIKSIKKSEEPEADTQKPAESNKQEIIPGNISNPREEKSAQEVNKQENVHEYWRGNVMYRKR